MYTLLPLIRFPLGLLMFAGILVHAAVCEWRKERDANLN